MSAAAAPRLEVLHIAGCPNLAALLDGLREVSSLPIVVREIGTAEEAAAARMAGSPTLLVDGADPFRALGDDVGGGDAGGGGGLACRLFRDDDGRVVPAPTAEQLRRAIDRATPHDVARDETRDEAWNEAWDGAQRATLKAAQEADQEATRDAAPEPADVVAALAALRAPATPSDPEQRAVHRAILRAFAATGHPATPADLDAASLTATTLAALHELDAIRLDAAGRIVVAYPFSATPTRHRVRIAGHIAGHTNGHIDAYAMCAIDALGIAPMLGQDTRIDSTDPVDGRTVTVVSSAGRTRWDPAGAVVFAGIDTCGGAAADCCCDHLNFFTGRASAHAWAASHPRIPGRVLDQGEALRLAADVFGPLLA